MPNNVAGRLEEAMELYHTGIISASQLADIIQMPDLFTSLAVSNTDIRPRRSPPRINVESAFNPTDRIEAAPPISIETVQEAANRIVNGGGQIMPQNYINQARELSQRELENQILYGDSRYQNIENTEQIIYARQGQEIIPGYRAPVDATYRVNSLTRILPDRQRYTDYSVQQVGSELRGNFFGSWYEDEFNKITEPKYKLKPARHHSAQAELDNLVEFESEIVEAIGRKNFDLALEKAKSLPGVVFRPSTKKAVMERNTELEDIRSISDIINFANKHKCDTILLPPKQYDFIIHSCNEMTRYHGRGGLSKVRDDEIKVAGRYGYISVRPVRMR